MAGAVRGRRIRRALDALRGAVLAVAMDRLNPLTNSKSPDLDSTMWLGKIQHVLGDLHVLDVVEVFVLIAYLIWIAQQHADQTLPAR
jgi:hypothetical protein